MTDHDSRRLQQAKSDSTTQRPWADQPSIKHTFGTLLEKTQELIGDKSAASKYLDDLLPVVNSNADQTSLTLSVVEELVNAMLRDLKTNEVFSGIWQPMVTEIAATLYQDPEAKRKLDLLWDFLRREFHRRATAG